MIERRNSPQRLVNFAKIKEVLAKNKLLWVGTTIVFTVAGAIYAVAKQDQWRTSQGLVVRDEAFGEMGFGPTGRFDNNDALKRSLETILQIAKHREVVLAALREVGPVRGQAGPNWPSETEIELLQEDITVTAPKGTEFGTSDLITLAVKAPQRDRSLRLTEALCDRLERRMKDLRQEHAQSIIAELNQKKKLAESDLKTVTLELSGMEADLGSDLGEMRMLTDPSAGGGTLQSQVNQIKLELRTAERDAETQAELLTLLEKAGDNTELLVATPNRLLVALPSLRLVKEGLVTAQLRTARLRGSMTEQHPAVRAAVLNEDHIRRQLSAEARHAITEVQAELAVSQTLVRSLAEKLAVVQTKLDRLAGTRADYANLTAKVEQRREQLRLANVALAEARGRQEAAQASSLITRLDAAVTSSRPLGPSRPLIVAGSLVLGLFLGLSLVYLIAPWQERRQARGRRQTDGQGRRATDRFSTETFATANGSERRGQPDPQPASPLQVQSLRDTLIQSGGQSAEQADATLKHLEQLAGAGRE